MLIYVKNSYTLCWYFLIFNVLEMEMEGVLLERAQLGLSPRKTGFLCHPPTLPPPSQDQPDLWCGLPSKETVFCISPPGKG